MINNNDIICFILYILVAFIGFILVYLVINIIFLDMLSYKLLLLLYFKILFYNIIWKYGMKMPDGSTFMSEGVYSEIIEQEKIVTSADFRPMTEGVELQALFQADGDKTNFTFRVIHKDEEYRIQQEKMGIYNGWGSVFDRLATFLQA